MSKYSVEAFLSDCRANGPVLLDVRQADAEETFRRALYQPFAVIGRADNADVPLKEPRLHNRHAYLQVLEGRVYYVNFGGLTGGPDCGEEDGCRWLDEKHTLRLGRHRLSLVSAAGQAPAEGHEEISPLASGSAAQLGMPSLTLEFLSGDSVRLRWRMNRLLVLVGSSPGCKVRVADEGLSRFHCSLVSTPRGVWFVDLLSRAGVCLNGVRTRYARVEDGDVLQLGSLSVRVRYDDPSLTEIYPPGYLENGAVSPDRAAVAGLRAAAPLCAPSPPLAAGPLPPSPLETRGPALALPGDSQEQGLAALAMPLLSQFNLMQQQMFDQFHQATLQMFQLFSGLHKDQLGFLRTELDRQRELTRELHALQTELSKVQAAKPGADGRRNEPDGGPSGKAPARAVPASEGVAAGARGPALPPADKPPTPAEHNGLAGTPHQGGEDVHALLCQRMAALQRERQTGWQRIVNFLVGKGSGGAAPY